jgi:hypothetical protein
MEPREPTPTPAEPATPPPAVKSDGYEFSSEQDVLIAALASKMKFVGLFALGLGVVAIIYGALRRDPGVIVSGALYGVIGLWTERSAVSFRHIATTHGHDIGHLMHALRDLRRLYTLQYWVCLISLVAMLIVLGASVLGSRG